MIQRGPIGSGSLQRKKAKGKCQQPNRRKYDKEVECKEVECKEVECKEVECKEVR